MLFDQGTVTAIGGYNIPEGYCVYIEHGNDEMAFYEKALKLVYRPQPTDGGADEYNEIIAGQTLMDQS